MSKIELPQDEVDRLKQFVSKGTKNAKEIQRAYVLLLTNKGKPENEIAEILEISRATVSNVKHRYREGGIENTIEDKPRPGQPKKYKEEQEAIIIAMACTDPPKGRKRWSLRLLTSELNKRSDMKTINRETVRLILKKAKLNLG